MSDSPADGVVRNQLPDDALLMFLSDTHIGGAAGSDIFESAAESVILSGPVGVGKTHLAQALGHIACRRGHSVTFAKTARLLAELAGGHADRTWEARPRKLVHLAADPGRLRPA
jgi:hypothetical protein